MARNIKLHAEKAPWTDAIQFVLMEVIDGKRYVSSEVVMKEHIQPEIIEPVFSLPYENAQLLIDELWNCGLRPTEGTGSAGALAATQSHLKDMQELAKRFLSMIENK